MPNQPRDNNRAHTIRVSDELWARVVVRADEKGETVSEAVRRFLERYVREGPPNAEGPRVGATVGDILDPDAAAAFIAEEKKWKRAARKRVRSRRV